MLAIIGAIVVFASVVGGYMLEKGPLAVLFQPAEILVIFGSMIGSLMISTPISVLKGTIGGIGNVIRSASPKKEDFLDLLAMLYQLFGVARRDGLMKIEADVDNPPNSAIFSNYPAFLNNHHAVSLLCDTMKVMVGGGVAPHELEVLMDADLDTHHDENARPTTALSKVGDSLPGLGIVAAVLGIIVTMQAVGGPPEEIGHKVAAALVGTFMGILLSYGFVSPLATNMEFLNASRSLYLSCIRESLLAFARGATPIVAVEFGRRAIYSNDRPDYKELEERCRSTKRQT